MIETSAPRVHSSFTAGASRLWGARVARMLLRILGPAGSILLLWYLAIWLSGLPEFVIPRPSQVLSMLIEDRNFITVHLVETLKVAAAGFVLANLLGIGLAIIFVAIPLTRTLLMPAAITLRNIPYVALVSVLVLAIGSGFGSRIVVVTIAGFFPILVNTYRGLLSTDPVVLDRMRILDANPVDIFLRVRLPFSLPFIIAAQEITASGAIIVAIVVEWMIATEGLGFVINRAMVQYRGDQVYAVAFLAAALSFGAYSIVQILGRRLAWKQDGV